METTINFILQVMKEFNISEFHFKQSIVKTGYYFKFIKDGYDYLETIYLTPEEVTLLFEKLELPQPDCILLQRFSTNSSQVLKYQ